MIQIKIIDTPEGKTLVELRVEQKRHLRVDCYEGKTKDFDRDPVTTMKLILRASRT